MTSGSRLVEISEFFHPGSPVGGWQVAATDADQASSPVDARGLELADASVPGTVASDLALRGELSRENPPDLDGRDYWYRATVAGSEWPESMQAGARRLLVLDGLATVATVWMNEVQVLEAENMYRRYAVDVTDLVREKNEIAIRFAALGPQLKKKKGPRRWPTRLVKERNLRFFRTTFLGRMPGWTPPWPAVGPYRGVRLVTSNGCVLHELRAVPSVDSEGARLDVVVRCSTADGRAPDAAWVDVADESAQVEFVRGADGCFEARLTVRPRRADLWWPHTHGKQPLYPAQLRIRSQGSEERFSLGCVGFRSVELLPPEDFGFRINGVDVFCRGGCWMPLDAASLNASDKALRAALEQVREGGMNMLRVSGVTLYEHPEFHRLCDELGILVWQDFMFANMDYPREDPAFDAEVDAEVAQVTERLGRHCSTALFCGSSETEQQAAMMGIPAEQWEHPLWRERLPRLTKQLCPSIPYWYSSPGGQGMPFWPQHGCTHYFGVGAYMRPLIDARVAGVRFASECLAFANPEEPGATTLPTTELPLGRVPKDTGASWDFCDTTDHYVGLLFGPEAQSQRGRDPEAYARIARCTTAQVLREAQAHFRDPATACRGSLVWTLRDLEPGSGWGIVDCDGRPKSGYFALKRMWAARAAWFVDEGLSGLAIVVANDEGTALDARLRLGLYLADGRAVEEVEIETLVNPFGQRRYSSEALLGSFFDTTQSYHFGPAAFDYARVVLERDGRAISQQLWFVKAAAVDSELAVCIREARVLDSERGDVAMVVESNRAARAVQIRVEGLQPTDNYFDLAGDDRRTVVLTGARDQTEVDCTIDALNLSTPYHARIRLDRSSDGGEQR